MKTQYDSHTEVLKKRNDSLLEDCERHREVGLCLLSMQVSFHLFSSFGYLIVYSLAVAVLYM